MRFLCFVSLMLLILPLGLYSESLKIKDIARIVGSDSIQVYGYSVVVGLKGTGDTSKNYATSLSIIEHLRKFGIDISHTNIQMRNTAFVLVSARIPSNFKKGTTFDVNVSSIFDARSLEGGFLITTPLKDSEGNVVAYAQGSVITPKGNVKTTGIVPNGGLVSVDLGTSSIDQGSFRLFFENLSPPSINGVIKLLKENFEKINIKVIDVNTLEIEIPQEFQGNEFDFVSRVMDTEVSIPDESFVVIDQRSSSIIITGNPRVYNTSISYKGMRIEFGELNFFERGEVYYIPSNYLKDFVDHLSKLGVKSDDLIQILLLMKEAGAIRSRFIVY
ncbi:MAG: flagellar basal body P-ring protein FlgI [Brevinematales bacterium]|nr:flagellar basal body P-ring protein FlgI [Brevinematales bacterium]